MFPLNITFSHNDTEDWHYDMEDYYKGDREYRNLFRDFSQQILRPILEYNIPIIQLDKETPKEAVCQIFENVNTGGVPLTAQLVTATFAAEGHELRKDWETIRHIFAQKVNGELLKEITGANFLAAMTLLVSYYKRVVSGDDERVAVTCKKKDILRLELKDYLKYHDALIKGFCDAADFLVHRGFSVPEIFHIRHNLFHLLQSLHTTTKIKKCCILEANRNYCLVGIGVA